MGKLPIYGAMAPLSQTGPSTRQALQQRVKATNFDYAQQQFSNQPFQAGQNAAGLPQLQQLPRTGPAVIGQNRTVPVGRGQTMQMQADPYGSGLLGMYQPNPPKQIGDSPVSRGPRLVIIPVSVSNPLWRFRTATNKALCFPLEL
jgi:hypothetical protein